jgi:hypothetical protein
MNTRFVPCFLALVLACTAACTGEPPAPKPEQYFQDARNNLASLDFDSALKNLERMIAAAEGQPLGQQGSVLRVALLTALADGARQMGEAYATGMKEPAAEPRQAQFTKWKADYYGMSRSRLIPALEGVMQQRDRLGDASIPLEVAFPNFTAQDHAAVVRIKSGALPADEDRVRAEREAARNALARVLARLAGAGEDVNKGQAAFQKGGVQVDPRIYLIEMSNTFFRLGEIFERRGLDDQRYLRITLEVVRDTADVALKLLAAKPDKDLEARARKLKADCEKKLKTLS